MQPYIHKLFLDDGECLFLLSLIKPDTHPTKYLDIFPVTVINDKSVSVLLNNFLIDTKLEVESLQRARIMCVRQQSTRKMGST